MKCLSVRQPYAWCLFHGKDVENRTWPLPHEMIGQRILIHAAKTDYDIWGKLDKNELAALSSPLPTVFVHGAIIGTVKIIGYIAKDESTLNVWKVPGQYGFQISEPYEFTKPIPYRGQLGFFEVPDETLGGI